LDPIDDISLFLCRAWVHTDGSSPAADCPYTTASSGTPGYSAATVDIGTTVRSHFDVEPDGTVDEVRWTLYVHQTVIVPGALSLGDVRAAWNRQVSPPPATATFNDVPTDHPQFAFVEALVSAGITAGCGGGNYCPNNPLTRGQMAVFLSKALGLNWS